MFKTNNNLFFLKNCRIYIQPTALKIELPKNFFIEMQ